MVGRLPDGQAWAWAFDGPVSGHGGPCRRPTTTAQGTQHTYIPWWGLREAEGTRLPPAGLPHPRIGGRGRHMPSMGMAGVLEKDDMSVGDGPARQPAQRSRLDHRPSTAGGEDDPQRRLLLAPTLDPTRPCLRRTSGGIPVLRFPLEVWARSERNSGPHGSRPFTEGHRRCWAAKVDRPSTNQDGPQGDIPRGGEIDPRGRQARMGASDKGTRWSISSAQSWGGAEPLRHGRRDAGLQPRQEPEPCRSWRWPGARPTTSQTPGQAGGPMTHPRPRLRRADRSFEAS